MAKRKQKRLTFKQKRAASLAKFKNDTGGNPYTTWPECKDDYIAKITATLTVNPQPFTYEKNKGKPIALSIEDLAIALFAVDMVGAKGISHVQLSYCFTIATNNTCHSSKAAALFKSLIALGLIFKVGNYAAFAQLKRGNMYTSNRAKAEEIRGVDEDGNIKPLEKTGIVFNTENAITNPPDPDDNPFE